MRRSRVEVTTITEITNFYIFPQLMGTGKHIGAGCRHLVICRILKQSHETRSSVIECRQWPLTASPWILLQSWLCRRGFWQLLSRLKHFSGTCLSALVMGTPKTGRLLWLRMRAKRTELPYLKNVKYKVLLGMEENKRRFWVCFVLCCVCVRKSLLAHRMDPGGQGKRQCAKLVKYIHIQMPKPQVSAASGHKHLLRSALL